MRLCAAFDTRSDQIEKLHGEALADGLLICGAYRDERAAKIFPVAADVTATPCAKSSAASFDPFHYRSLWHVIHLELARDRQDEKQKLLHTFPSRYGVLQLPNRRQRASQRWRGVHADVVG